MSKGKLIAFEGVDGCGKSTQIARLAEALREAGYTVTTVREPGGTPAGEAVRSILKNPETPLSREAELLLFAAARAQVVADVIRPALARGEIVLCDRFTDSTLAYQGGGRGIPLETIREVNRIATGGLTPDLVIFLRIPIKVAQARAIGRGGVAADRFDSAGRDFFLRTAAVYESQLACSPFAEWVDADSAPDAIAAQVRARALENISNASRLSP